MEKNDKNSNHGNRVLKLTINGKLYEWNQQYILGSEIRKLGNIPNDEKIFLAIKEPWEDEPIENTIKVDLARPEIEHFFSKEEQQEIIIIVNGSPKKWDKKQISFKEVIILAYGNYNDSATTVYTVAYEDGPKQNPEGSMIKDSVVFVKNKMIFHATATNKS